ncbi:MAG: HYR domain-containing protein [Marinilabiliales bacterium]|nr:HYR domain-containing protein [Marinilabiliales bacterium]
MFALIPLIGTEFDPTVTENCPDWTLTNDYNNSNALANAVFNKGTTTVTWTVTDRNGNSASCELYGDG